MRGENICTWIPPAFFPFVRSFPSFQIEEKLLEKAFSLFFPSDFNNVIVLGTVS